VRGAQNSLFSEQYTAVIPNGVHILTATMLHHTGLTTKPIQHIDSTINVGTATVQLNAQPMNTYVLIRVVNHWINNLLEFHDGDSDINKNQTWYIKWSSKYPHIRSSKRSLYEVYRALSEDGNIDVNDVTMYSLVTWLKDNIPQFIKHYDIKEQEGNKNNMNNFTFSLSLVYSPFNDPNNRFTDYTSQNDKFVPFTANRSIATRNTELSQTGTSIVSDEAQDMEKVQSVPATVNLDVITTANDDDLQVSETDNQKISGDTNLSYSPITNINDNSEALHPSTRRQRKKTEDLKQIISNTCKNEIQSELQNFKDELHKSMSSYTDNLKKMYNAEDKPDIVKSEAATMIPPTYRQSMPSPNPRKPDEKLPTSYKYDQSQASSNADQYNTKFQQSPYQKHNALSFLHNGYTWDLRDAAFLKDTGNLMVVKTDHDLVQFYKQIQAMAIMFNIFVQRFQNLQPWNRSANTIPSTCIFTTLNSDENTITAYRRMKSALYTKISKATFLSPVHAAIVQYGITQQDGFEVLYDLMTHCHPKLLQANNRFRQTNKRPEFEQSDSIYSYVNKLQTYLDIENINNHEFSNDDVLNMMVEQLQDDTRYEIAIAGIRSELMLRDTVQRQLGDAPFPESLQLRNLPATIMSYYTEEDKKALFPAMDTVATVRKAIFQDYENMDAVVNSMRRNNLQARESVDKTCKGCGQFGHDVYHQGCDFCAKFMLATEYLQQNPSSKKGILYKYKKHQNMRKEARTNKDDKAKKADYNSKRTHRYNTRSQAKVNMLTDLLTTALNFDSDEGDTDYEDAQQETNSNSEEAESDKSTEE
jgi:hypothetical protein